MGHAFLLIKFGVDYGLCVEKFHDRLEVVFGRYRALKIYATEVDGEGCGRRVDGKKRKPCRLEKNTPIHGPSLKHILRLLDTHRYVAYDLMSLNCKVFTEMFVTVMIECCHGQYPHWSTDNVSLDVVLAAVKRNGNELKDVPMKFSEKEYKEIVTAAVQQNGHALRHARRGLNDDIEIVMHAVHNRGTAISFASAALQRNLKVKEAAVQQNNRLRGLRIDSILERVDTRLEGCQIHGVSPHTMID